MKTVGKKFDKLSVLILLFIIVIIFTVDLDMSPLNVVFLFIIPYISMFFIMKLRYSYNYKKSAYLIFGFAVLAYFFVVIANCSQFPELVCDNVLGKFKIGSIIYSSMFFIYYALLPFWYIAPIGCVIYNVVKHQSKKKE